MGGVAERARGGDGEDAGFADELGGRGGGGVGGGGVNGCWRGGHRGDGEGFAFWREGSAGREGFVGIVGEDAAEGGGCEGCG